MSEGIDRRWRTATLSRERAKEMASDFTRAPSASRVGADIDWRQISLPLSVDQKAAEVPSARVTDMTMNRWDGQSITANASTSIR